MTTDTAALRGAGGRTRETKGGDRGREARAIAMVSSAHFVQHFQSLVVPPLFPFLKAALGIGFIELGFALTIANIVAVLAQLPVGFLVDRVGSRRLRTVTLPHHRTSGFPHPAVEPGSGINPLRPAMVMKPVALLLWSLHSAPLRCISSGAGLPPLSRFLLAGPLLYSPLPELSGKCALGSLPDCFGKLLAPLFQSSSSW